LKNIYNFVIASKYLIAPEGTLGLSVMTSLSRAHVGYLLKPGTQCPIHHLYIVMHFTSRGE